MYTISDQVSRLGLSETFLWKSVTFLDILVSNFLELPIQTPETVFKSY